MRKLVYLVATSVDHYIARADGSVHGFADQGDHVPAFLEMIKKYDAVLMGTKTYEFGFQYGLKPGQPGYAGIKHYIFSKSLQFNSNAEVELVQTDAITYIRQMKDQPGRDIWLCGGSALAGSLLESGLIDELILKVYPIVLGQGLPLFGASTRELTLDLYESRVFQNGVAFSSYWVNYV